MKMLKVAFNSMLKPPTGILFGSVQIRTNKIIRTPIPDVSKYVPLLDETQLFVPVVHRRHEFPPLRINGPGRRMRGRHYVYDLVEPPPNTPFPDVEVILIKDVPGKGVKGTRLKMPGDKVYAQFLIPQYAVYATPENEEKYASLIEEAEHNSLFSTLTAQKTSHTLRVMMAFFYMNMINPWTIERWHARVALRQGGIVAEEDCIELPSKPITGPDPAKEGKHFIIHVTINGKERSPLLCRINHFINDEAQKLPVPPHYTPPFDPVFEEDRENVLSHVRNRELIKSFKL